MDRSRRSTGFLESVFCSTVADLSAVFAAAAARTNRIGLEAFDCGEAVGVTEYVITRCGTTVFTDVATK